jgi:hypothetical protein
MTVFTVHTPPITGNNNNIRVEDAVFVPEQKTLMALVFPFFWLLWQRLWWAVVFYLLVSVILSMLLLANIGLAAFLLTIIPGLFLYLEGQELRRKALHRKGWKYLGVVEGSTRSEAEIRFFHQVQQPTGTGSTKPTFKPLRPKQIHLVDPGIDFLANPETI